MILWTIKQLNSIRLAIAGRQHPSQLAWGVAFGLLLGVVPHGNLLAVMLVLLVLSLKLNHAIAGLTAVGVTFAAGHLDPWSDEIGRRILTHPESRRWAEMAWEYPLVPWTDLNNTVVLGSFSIGLAMLVPTFCVCYPVFRRLGPSRIALPPLPRTSQAGTSQAEPADAAAAAVAEPTPTDARRVAATAGDAVSVDLLAADPRRADARGEAETEVGADARGKAETQGSAETVVADAVPGEPRMEESLRFLLHQLRDSKPKDAA